MSSRRQEDLSQNRFLQVLRASFEGIYRQAAQRGDRTVILVPCAECLEAEHFGQSFVETHLLQASPMPGCFMNHLGQGVEIKENSVATQLGFQEHRLCEVLQKDSMYDLSNTFKVLVIDKPLIGRFKPLSAAVPEPGSAGNLDDLLLHSPSIQGEFFDEVDRFRKTFVQVPGCENRTAERIREIVTEAVDKLSRQHKVTSASQVAQLEFKVSRQAYTALYSFIFPHLQSLLTEKEDRLQRSVRSYASLDDLLKAVPGGERLCFVDVTESAAELELLEGKIAPHEKIECVDKAHALLQKSIASLAPERSSTPMEITGDDVLSLFILVVYRSQVKNFLAHVCHMEMYLQGPSRSGGGARFEEAGYAVSALQAGLQFFMEEERPVAPTGPSVFSCLGSQGPEEASHLQGLVRSARAQAAR